MSAALSEFPDDGAGLIGTYRRIAGVGPVYEVVAAVGAGKIKICLVESGDTLDYPVTDAWDDPED